MHSNRRRRTVVLAALLVLLLAGVLGELSFGDHGGVASAQAEVVAGVSEGTSSTVDGGLDAGDRRDGASTGAADGGSASSEVGPGRPVADPNPGSGSVDDGVDEGVAPSPVAIPPAATAPVTNVEPVVGDNGGVPAPQDDAGTTVEDGDGGCDRTHGVDDHAVEHSDRHAESEAVSHGRDEEAHLHHRSND